MNKILILLFAILCSLCMNAQKKSDFEKAIKNYSTQIPQLEKKYESIKANNARISKRSFVTETPEQSLRRRLAYYKDIKEMAGGNIFRKRKEYQNLPISKSYISLIKMYISLSKDGGYNQDENEAFKNELDAIKEHGLDPLTKHQKTFIQSFDDLDNCIRNYRFAMFELARIFVLVEEKEKEGLKPEVIYTSLQDDEETSFVDQIPYTQIALQTYCARPDKRSEILRKLKASCAEAFKNFKE